MRYAFLNDKRLRQKVGHIEISCFPTVSFALKFFSYGVCHCRETSGKPLIGIVGCLKKKIDFFLLC